MKVAVLVPVPMRIGDGIQNYLDTDFPGFVDTNSDGINDNFDADLDGGPNHRDINADKAALADATENDGGVLPAHFDNGTTIVPLRFCGHQRTA